MTPAPASRAAIRGNKMLQVGADEVDWELPSANNFFGSHIGLIPMQSAVQGPRLFYGARFFNQAMPVRDPEAPLVQNKPDDDDRSFDEILGARAGAFRADAAGTVDKVTPKAIHYTSEAGEKKQVPIYHRFAFNRKTAIHSTPVVKPGDKFTPGQLLAHSNFTDKNGTLAMGRNARIGLVAYKGHSMDDAVVISEDFAKKLVSEHLYSYDQEFDDDVKGGRNHFVSLFPTKFKQTQLGILDEDGVVKEGTILRAGDPMVLATKPRAISSATTQLGKLSKAMRDARADASQSWEHDEEGVVTDVVKTPKGAQVYVQTYQPTKVGDKITQRSGNKGVVSKIVPSDQMPRTMDGKPLDILLNHLGLPSRVNSSLLYEILLGKVAAKNGQPYKLPAFNRPDEKWYDFVKAELDKAGMKETEDLWDPAENRKLERPVTVGNAFILKLHHTAESKASSRGIGSYTADGQPARGGGEHAQSKRLSGLESTSLLSSGAYATLREASTLRGARNDDYWRSLRSGYTPRAPGTPMVFDKFRALLSGAGIRTTEKEKGKLRLGPFTDKDLDERKPVEVENGELVDLNTIEPNKGGLFDPTMVASNRWGRIRLPHSVPNPAFESQLLKLLGLKERELREILAGRMEMPEHLR
jgi:DNA-directed RNA polymerase subunit beta